IRGAEASRSLLFNIDNKWGQITVNIPAGFRRITNHRRINDARNRIDFALIDRELSGEAFPAGIIDADIDYDFENIPPAFICWRSPEFSRRWGLITPNGPNRCKRPACSAIAAGLA